MSASVPSRHAVRTPLRILGALAIALSLMASVSPARAAAGKVTAKVTASLTASTVLPRSSTVLSGTVTPHASSAVVLQRYVKGAWVQVAHHTAGTTGHYSFAIRTSTTLGTSLYRVVVTATRKATGAISKTLHLRTVKTAFKVTATSRSAVASGAPVTVTGTVAHKATGFVLLQMLQHGTWKTMWTGRLSKTSGFSFSHVLAAGKYDLRVRKAATATIAAGVSKSIKVTVAAPPAAPTAAITLSGQLVSAGVYSGPVTATATTTAPANIASLTYTLDGGAAHPYTAPVVVSSVGAHTFSVTVTDALGRAATANSAWTISSTQSQNQQPGLPTAAITLTGTLSNDVYVGAVSVTLGGTNAASIAYQLDGGSTTAYTSPFSVATPGSHTVVETVTDQAGNVATATKIWSQKAAVGGSHDILVTSADQATLRMPTARLVFSTSLGQPQSGAGQAVHVTNTTANKTITINLAEHRRHQPRQLPLRSGPGDIVHPPARRLGSGQHGVPAERSDQLPARCRRQWHRHADRQQRRPDGHADLHHHRRRPAERHPPTCPASTRASRAATASRCSTR